MDHAHELPEKIDKYEILGVAGRGGMGVVYHAHDPFFDRDVAIKTTQRLAPTAEYTLARQMLFNEARAAQQLDHSAILQVFDAGEFGGEPYVVMEYVPQARTLREHCNTDSLLPMERAVEIIHTCARALDHAHQRGIVHRDIKAGNILLTLDDQVKIADFGIARNITRDDTDHLAAVGSPRFMSPEQFMERPLTPQTDLYSLGAVLYELLCGQPAFEGASIPELARKILTVTPTPVHELRAEVPRALSGLTARAMSKRTDDRFGSGAEMADALAAIFGQIEPTGKYLTAERKFQLARELIFFEEFTDMELRELTGACSWQNVGAGTRIIREGNMERSCYVVISGDVAVSKGGKRIGTLSRGQCFGEMGFLSRNSPRTATVHARGEVTLLLAEASVFSDLSPTVQLRFQQRVVNTMIERLASTTERLSKLLDYKTGQPAF